MSNAAAKGAVKGAVAAAVISVVAAGYAYTWQGTSYAAAAGHSPVAGWNACLLEKPSRLTAAQPGISPGSRLAYRPLVTEDNSLEGWEFFGHFRNDRESVNFICRSGTEGQDPRWLVP